MISKNVVVRMPARLISSIDACLSEGQTRSDFVRSAVEKVLEKCPEEAREA